jgi:hypothetical protein
VGIPGWFGRIMVFVTCTLKLLAASRLAGQLLLQLQHRFEKVAVLLYA